MVPLAPNPCFSIRICLLPGSFAGDITKGSKSMLFNKNLVIPRLDSGGWSHRLKIHAFNKDLSLARLASGGRSQRLKIDAFQ